MGQGYHRRVKRFDDLIHPIITGLWPALFCCNLHNLSAHGLNRMLWLLQRQTFDEVL